MISLIVRRFPTERNTESVMGQAFHDLGFFCRLQAGEPFVPVFEWPDFPCKERVRCYFCCGRRHGMPPLRVRGLCPALWRGGKCHCNSTFFFGLCQERTKRIYVDKRDATAVRCSTDKKKNSGRKVVP